MRTEPTLVVQRPWQVALKATIDPMLFALACAMLAGFLYAAGTFAIRIYNNDEHYDNSESVPPAQPW